MANFLTRAAARLDGWINLFTQVGTGIPGAKTDFSFQADNRLDDQTLENIYHGDPLASRICRIVPDEALRQGYRIACGDPEVESRVMTKLTDLKADESLAGAWTWARVFGGGAIFMGADDGLDPSLPLDETALTDVRFLVVLDKRELIPSRWYSDPLSAKFGGVEVYRFARAGGVGVDTREVHETRLLRFQGVRTTRRRQILLQGWGESELQRVYSVLQQFNGNFAAVSALVQDSSQGVFGIKGLYEMMAGDNEDALKKRLQMMDLSRSVARSILVDANEETYSKVETGTLSGLSDLLDKYALLLSGASEMPVSLLLGQAPAGLQATGDSDIRWFYDRIKTDQNTRLRLALERLVRLLMRCDAGPTNGLEPGKWSLDFNPLWQPTEKEQADTRFVVAQTDALYIDKQVVTSDEVAVNRFRPEGWSMETSLDLEARKAMIEADLQAQAQTAGVVLPPTVDTKPPVAQTDLEGSPAQPTSDPTEGGLKAPPLPAPEASSPIWVPPPPASPSGETGAR